MKFDAVHDAQKSYRAILSGMAFPGSVVDLSREASLLDVDAPFGRGLLLFAMTLLDGETEAAFFGTGRMAQETFLARMTYTRIVPPEQASFLFFPLDGMPGAVSSASAGSSIVAARRGTLVDPHLGATVVLEVESLSKGSGRPEWVLSGPGIKESATLGPCSWGREDMAPILRARNESCGEFPLGIELVLVDRRGCMACIPRSSSVREA